MNENNNIVYPDGNEFQEILDSNNLAMIDFSSTWCTPCSMLEPTIKELANEYDGRVVVGKVDVDKNARIAEKYNIKSIPTVILFKDGGELDRIVGLNDKERYKDLLDENL